MLDLGLCRLVIGTLALREPDWFRRMCRQFPGRLVLGIDARDGRVATEGWLETSDVRGDRVGPAVRRRADRRGDLYRHRDRRHAGRAERGGHGRDAGGGRRAGGRLRRRDDGDDVARLAAVPMAGCIIGRALYEGTLTLPDALAAAAGQSEAPRNVIEQSKEISNMAKYPVADIRNIAFCGHGSAGKTTLVDKLLDHHGNVQPAGQRRRRHQHLRLRRGRKAAQVHDRGHAWSTSSTPASGST